LRDVELLTLMVARGAKLDVVDQCLRSPMSGCAALHVAVRQPKLDFAEALLVAGASIDVKSLKDELTPLALLCRSKSGVMSATEVTNALWLLERGADPMARNRGAETPMHLAADSGSLVLLEALVARGATLVEDKYGKTPLWNTLDTNFRKEEIWDYLFSLGEQLERVAGGDTPLLDAQMRRNETAVRYLLARGADAQAKDAKGRTALDRARELKQDGVIAILEKATRVR